MTERETPSHVLAVGLDPGELAGTTVETADDLLGALARLADGGVDLVLLSLDLPDAQGADAVKAIRDRAPAVPVIAVTAGPGAEDAIDAGASDVLPTDADRSLIERAVRYARHIHRLEAEMLRRQVLDEATGLYNARGFEQLAAHHLALADRTRRPVVLVFVRPDALDEVEDDADHHERARLLRETAEVLRSAVRDSDVLARVGTGAFCVLLTGDSAGAESLVLSRLIEAVAARNARSGTAAQLSISVGAAAYDPGRPVSIGELLDEADRRMRSTEGHP